MTSAYLRFRRYADVFDGCGIVICFAIMFYRQDDYAITAVFSHPQRSENQSSSQLRISYMA